jgi:hypothetical protein
MSLVPIAQSQVLQKHLDLRVSRFLGFQLREVEIHYIVAFSGKVLATHMDRVNLESSDLKAIPR